MLTNIAVARTGSGLDLSLLYSCPDPTGVLSKHRSLVAKPFAEKQVDLKILYYELIRLLVEEEGSADKGTAAISRIEGYQQLTNQARLSPKHFDIGD